VEIDHQRGVAGAGVGLRVPAIVEVVAERLLRAAVDDVGERILLRRIEAHGLDEVGVDRVALGPDEGELLGVAERHVDEGLAVELRQPLLAAASRRDRPEVGRRVEGVA